MPLKVIRRPYQDCAYRWALSTSGISTGEGDCSEAQCLDLNGDFNLDFSACASKGGNLVWAGDCEVGPVLTGCLFPECGNKLPSRLAWTPPVVTPTGGGGAVFSLTGIGGNDLDFPQDFAGYLGALTPSAYIISCCFYDRQTWVAECDDPDATTFLRWSRATPDDGKYHGAFSVVAYCSVWNYDRIVVDVYYRPDAFGASTSLRLFATYETDALGDCLTQYVLHRATVSEPRSCGPLYAEDLPSGISVAFPGDTITITVPAGSTGPEANDRIRSKWHLDYDIEAQLWTLRSFNKVDYPKYTLSDASPCDGETKTLLLADKGDAADGCGIAPAEVTITRVCPPDRVGKSALLEDRKPNGATGKRKRQCGCDCLDEVDDRRQCATKCASAATEGCERIDPAPDDITCRYPEAINCCATTAGKDVPCAYTVEFECDLFFDIESVRHKIAAKQVTLRRECYFEDPCLFVAPGPESSTGGSPVMDTDGFPGAQPVCASCSDPCLTGCTWDAYTVAECPSELDKCDIVSPVSRENCLEFRWTSTSTSGFTVGDVAAVLHYVSETVTAGGSFNWLFKSDDGEWVANILPNTVTTCVAGSPPTLRCGFGSLGWSDAPADFPGSVNWLMQVQEGTLVRCYNIYDSDIPFAYPEFGVDSTTLKMNWITCP